MKKVLPGLICLLLITSCGLENLPPKSLTVKGNPGLYVPLGSPFAHMKEEERLEYLISTKNVKKMMNNNTAKAGVEDEVEIYEVSKRLAEKLGADREVRTYLAHYPLMEMPLNLKKYADDAMASVKAKREINIPVNTAGLPVSPTVPLYINGDGILQISEDTPNPFLKIPLSKMAKLVKKVENGKYGLEIDYSPELAQNLEIKIPGLGITNYIPGIPTDNDGNQTAINPTKLQYYELTKKDFYPQKRQDSPGSPVINSDLDDGANLWIYARITGPCPGKLEPIIIFEWTRAQIDTSSTEDLSTFMGDYAIKNTLSEFLGEGVTFKKIIGFMYMSGVEAGRASMIAAIYDTEKFDNGYRDPDNDAEDKFGDDLLSEEIPIFQDGYEFDGELDPMSLIHGPLDLTGIFESSDRTLQFAIKINDIWYDNDANDETYIKFDLLVLIPMDLKISKQVTNAGADIQNKYVMLDLGDSLKNNSKEGDLFGRKEGGDNYLRDIEYVNIGLKFSASDINIIKTDKLSVLVTTKNGNKLLEFKNNKPLRLTGNFLNDIPFSPEFSVLLEKDKDENFGSFRILRPEKPSFDFRLYVEAKAALEYAIKL